MKPCSVRVLVREELPRKAFVEKSNHIIDEKRKSVEWFKYINQRDSINRPDGHQQSLKENTRKQLLVLDSHFLQL